MRKALMIGATAAVAWAMIGTPAQAAEQSAAPAAMVVPATHVKSAKHASHVKHKHKHKKHKKGI